VCVRGSLGAVPRYAPVRLLSNKVYPLYMGARSGPSITEQGHGGALSTYERPCNKQGLRHGDPPYCAAGSQDAYCRVRGESWAVLLMVPCVYWQVCSTVNGAR